MHDAHARDLAATAQDGTWTAVVLRPENAGWDGRRFHGAEAEALDIPAIRSAQHPVKVVREQGFVAIVSPCARTAHEIAASLSVTWRAVKAPAHEQVREGPTYSWHAMPGADPDAAFAWASWNAQGDLALQVEDADLGRLHQELYRLFALDRTRIRITQRQSRLPRRDAPPGRHRLAHDAAIDAALIARQTGCRIAVSLVPQMIDEVHVTMQATRHLASETPTWTITPSVPIGDRPPWSLPDTGTASAQALGGSVMMPYGIDWTVAAARSPLTPRQAVPRNLSEQASVFALECFADDMAFEAGQDPVDWRLQRLQDPQGRALIETVAQRAGWDHTVVEPGETACTTRHGRGFACALTAYAQDEDDQEKRAWSAWVVDVKVDTASGQIDLTGMTVGHHVDGMYQPQAIDADLQASITDAATRLLGAAARHDEWTDPPAASYPQIQTARLPASRTDVAAPERLSSSPAMMLPLGAAISNAIFNATGLRLRAAPFDAHAFRRAALDASAPQGLPCALPGATSRRNSIWRRPVAWGMSMAAAAAGIVLTALPWRGAIAPVTPDISVYSEGAIERGRRIAAASDCVVCHTAPGGRENAGGLAMQTPFGTIYSTNITPDPVNGIGAWSYQAFERAMRHGVSRDGRHLYPAFPYTAFAKFSDADLQALYAYLMVQPAIEAAPPKTDLAFPYSMRPLMAGWNLLFHDAKPFEPDASRSVLWNRGAYLVNSAGHCSACHTPRNAFGAEQSGTHRFLSGASIDGWDAPALNALASGPLPWSKTELYTYLRTGHSARHGVAAGPMAPVIAGLGELRDQDILAMATYLMELPDTPGATAAPPAAPASVATHTAPASPEMDLASLKGRGIYEGACAACHDPGRGLPLFGVRPDLSTNTNIVAARPDNLIHVILQGITTPANDSLGYMPGFADALNDEQVAELVDYLRARYGADQPPWQDVRQTVARLRLQEQEHSTPETTP